MERVGGYPSGLFGRWTCRASTPEVMAVLQGTPFLWQRKTKGKLKEHHFSRGPLEKDDVSDLSFAE